MIFQLKCLKENISFARRVAFNNFEKKSFLRKNSFITHLCPFSKSKFNLYES